MAELMRLSRPWLRTSMRSPAPSLALFSLYRPIHTSRPCAAKPKLKDPKKMSSARRTSKGMEKAQQIEASAPFLLPLTLVAPPLWRYPRDPRQFFHFLYLHLKNRMQAYWSLVGIRMVSMDRKFTWPAFKAHRKAAIPTAKALQQSVGEAMAAGDKETLRRLCTEELFKTLAGAIDARPRGQRSDWQILKYEHPWRYPRLGDWRISYVPSHTGPMRLIKQAVVSIATVQRLERFQDDVKVPGTESTRSLVEHIVLQAEVDNATYESGPWKFWGWLTEATYEGYLEDLENTALLTNQAA
ncbi:hypothetical protein F5B20DRAFT_159817 [Whalleya microplaca]|nr:hypothetical protein F5B20DRAFT_159817 [Whalleya microplaca]